MASSAGIALGPLATGILQQATGDLRLSLYLAGLAMKHGLSGGGAAAREPSVQATDD